MRIGDITIHPLTDGTFRASPAYFGDHVRPEGHEHLFLPRDGMAWLPIGCFLVRTGDRTVLVDAGLGPALDEAGPRRLLVGGQLLLGLRAIGVAPADITDVVCTHLHTDHCGWLFDTDAAPVFTQAVIWFGTGDWDHFVEGEGDLADHIRRGLVSTRERGERVRLVGQDTTIAPGVSLIMTPGHTPGHLCVVVSSAGQRALLLGDAVICPVQLDEPSWRSMGDVDPELAQRVRDRLFRELEDDRTIGVGAHFPELEFGRVLTGQGRRWFT
jgi:glyoxylase-like metal-dependent hydrolase (beta-lactamase superfamily II)